MTEPSAPATIWRVSRTRTLSLDRARVIAILNVTPDSFSDGGELPTTEAAVATARCAVDSGADMLDIGGESTRPGAQQVKATEQVRRVVPAIGAIRDAGLSCPISVDTTRADVARAALDAGADAVNDVSGGTDDEAMLTLIAERGAGVILMHRLRAPGEDSWSDRYRQEPSYEGGVVAHVRRYLIDRAQSAINSGTCRESIAIDPGLGFGKSVSQNFALIAASGAFVETGFPVVGAASRKSFLGAVSGVESPSERVAASVAASVAQRLAGVQLFRVHDTRAQAQGLRSADAILGAINDLDASGGESRRMVKPSPSR